MMRLLVTGSIVAVMAAAGGAYAATPPSLILAFPVARTVAPGSEFSVPVAVVSDAPVNAFDIFFSYPPELELIGFNAAGSIVDVWQAGPRVTDARRVELVGGMVTPFTGGPATLVTLEFRAVREGEPIFTEGSFRWYAATGEGEELAGAFETGPGISVRAGAPLLALAAPAADPTPPTLTASVVYLADRTPIVSFDSRDRESGAAVTLVRLRRGFSWSAWQPAMNPIALPRGVWAAELLAVNGQGAEARATVYSWTAAVRALGLLAALGVALQTATVVYNKRKRTP